MAGRGAEEKWVCLSVLEAAGVSPVWDAGKESFLTDMLQSVQLSH